MTWCALVDRRELCPVLGYSIFRSAFLKHSSLVVRVEIEFGDCYGCILYSAFGFLSACRWKFSSPSNCFDSKFGDLGTLRLSLSVFHQVVPHLDIFGWLLAVCDRSEWLDIIIYTKGIRFWTLNQIAAQLAALRMDAAEQLVHSMESVLSCDGVTFSLTACHWLVPSDSLRRCLLTV